MKKLVCCIVVLCMLIAFVSCMDNKQAKMLFERVEAVMDEHPDSALAMLDSVKEESETYPRSQKMRYELLHAKAQNKAYVDFTSDSIMKEVVDYYDDHGTPNEQIEAHYLLGCVYRDLNEAPMALSCYLDATEKADTLSDDCDYGVLMRVWGQIANEYHRQAMPDEELKALKMMQKYAKSNNDIYSYIIGLELERRAYHIMEDTDMILSTANKVSKLFYDNNYHSDAAIAIYPIIGLYINRNDVQTADSLIKYFELNSGLINRQGEIAKGHEYYYNIKGQYFYAISKYDSAKYYFRKSYESGYQYDACKGLLEIFVKEQTIDSICKYSSLKEKAFDSRFKNLHTKSMYNAEGMFNYSRNQHIAAERTIAAERNKTNAIIVGLLSIIIILLLIRYVLKKRKELQNLEDICRTTKEEYLKSLQDYNLMESDFEAYKAMKSDEIQELEGKWEMASARLNNVQRVEVVSAVRSNEVIENILKKQKYEPQYSPEITEKEWDDVFLVLKKEFPLFYTSVIISPSLSDQERKIAVFALLGVGAKSTAYLLGTTPQNVTNAKASINTKLFSDNSAKTLHCNLVNL